MTRSRCRCAGTRLPPSWPADRAHRYLTHLAGHLHDAGTRDLASWQLRDTIPRPHRTLIFALLTGLAGMLATGNEPRLLLEAGLSFGLAAALASGLTVALTVGITRMVRGQRLRGMPRFLSGKSTIAIMVGGVVGSSWILGHMLMKEFLHDTASSINMGSTVGIMAGLGAGLAAGFIGLRSAGPQPARTRLRVRGQAREPGTAA